MAVILRYSTEFGGFNANYVKVDEDGHTLSAAKM